MSDAVAEPAKLSEVLRLATALSDHVLEAQITKRDIAPDQIAALVRAAGLLQDHGVPWPPLLQQVLHDVVNAMDSRRADAEAKEAEADDRGPVTGLTRFLSAFRREKGLPSEQ